MIVVVVVRMMVTGLELGKAIVVIGVVESVDGYHYHPLICSATNSPHLPHTHSFHHLPHYSHLPTHLYPPPNYSPYKLASPVYTRTSSYP